MGRPPIGIRAMTATERHQRWLDKQRAGATAGPCSDCARLQSELDALRAELDTLKATPPRSVSTEQAAHEALKAEVECESDGLLPASRFSEGDGGGADRCGMATSARGQWRAQTVIRALRRVGTATDLAG